MYSDLIALVRTKDEASKIKEELEIVTNALFSNTPEALNLALARKIDKDLAGVLKQAFDKGVDKVKFVKGAKAAIRELREITLTIAFEPREETKVLLSNWVRKNLGEGTVLELIFNENIVGGAQIVSHGNYRDFSLRRKISEFFKTQRSELTFP